jgi:hypothetical protein
MCLPAFAAQEVKADKVLIEKAARKMTLLHEGEVIKTHKIIVTKA